MNIPHNYRKPVLFAALFHAMLLCLLIFNFASNLFSMPPASSKAKTIHAVAISQAAVDQEIKQTQQPVVNQAAEQAAKAAEEQKLQMQKLKQEKAAELEQKHQEQLAHAREVEAQKVKAAASAKQALILQQHKMAQLKAQELQKEKKQKETQAKMVEAQKLKEEKIKAEKIKEEKLKAAQALAAEKQKQAAQAKLKQAEKLKAEKVAELAKENKLAQEQKALQQKLLQQQISGEAKNLSQIQSAAQQGVIDKYKAEILSVIQSNWRIDQVNSKLKCVYSVSLAPDGTVLSVTLIHGSGDAALDHSAQQAITLSSPLPVPHDPSVFNHFRQLIITLSPQGVLQSITSN